jgi:hypothetical protein
VEVMPGELVAPSSVPGDKAIEIRLRRGRSLVVEPGFDASHLHGLLAVWGSRKPCCEIGLGLTGAKKDSSQ